MKLYDWINKNLGVPWSQLKKQDIGLIEIKSYKTQVPPSIASFTDGLHVIGTCEGCQYWGDRDITWDEDARPYRICEVESISIFSPINRRSNAFLKDFGCIHFEEKGEK